MTIEEIEDEAVKPISPSERFRLAALILNEIPLQSVVDIRDTWNEQDMMDISAYSARLFATEYLKVIYEENDGCLEPLLTSE